MRISDWSSDVCSSDLAIRPEARGRTVSELQLGLLICVVTIAVLATGIPIAFGLGIVAMIFLVAMEGWSSLDFLSETLFGGLEDFTLVSIPMFIIMGAVVASSRASGALYESLHR